MEIFIQGIMLTLITAGLLAVLSAIGFDIWYKYEIPYFGKRTKVIRYYAREGFKYLKLTPIPVKLNCNTDNASYYFVGKIAIGMNHLTKKDADIHFNPFFSKENQIKSDLDHLKFTIFHEIGHYYIHTKYPEWQTKQTKLKRTMIKALGSISRKEYRQLAEERVADKIAFILMKNIK